MKPLDPAQRREVMELAWKLQAERDDAAEAQKHRELQARSGAELGLDPALLEEAEGLVRARALVAAQRASERRRLVQLLAFAGLGLGVLLAGGGAAWLALRPAPFAPWTDPMASGWSLDTSPGALAELRPGAHATVVVQRLPAGEPWVNLDSTAHPDWEGAEKVAFEVRGEGLRHVRLYLENPSLRWRGPKVPVSAAWTTQELALSVFERQERAGEWRVVEGGPPSSVKTVSFKLGWYVNEPGDAGLVELRNLRVE